MTARTQGRVALGLTAAATVWAAAMVPGAALTSSYSGTTHVDDSERGVYSYETSSTLVEENGTGVFVVLAIPLAITLVVWLALYWRCTRGRGVVLAWSLVGLLWAFAMIASASVGGYFLPGVALLALAAALTPRAGAL